MHLSLAVRKGPSKLVPLFFVENGAHVDEQHQLPLEQISPRRVDASRGFENLASVDLRAVDLSAQCDRRLFQLRLEIDELRSG